MDQPQAAGDEPNATGCLIFEEPHHAFPSMDADYSITQSILLIQNARSLRSQPM